MKKTITNIFRNIFTRNKNNIFTRNKNLELIKFRDLPLKEWFRFNIGKKPGLATTQKTYEKGGSAGDQYVKLSPDEFVWWVKNYSHMVKK